MEFSDLRRDFGRYQLDEKKLPSEPLALFKGWLEEAKIHESSEFNAMVLSTVSNDSRPSSRVVLLKQITEEGVLYFYTNYHSRKGEELAGNPFVALNFLWKSLEKQVRIEGKATRLSREISEEYFKSRPLESRISAIVSPQSRVIENLDELRSRAAAILQEHGEVNKPPFWGGYSVIPDSYEFWQGGKNRLHHRVRYRLQNAEWVRDRLAP